jgi:iron complex outermembrane receptor protein
MSKKFRGLASATITILAAALSAAQAADESTATAPSGANELETITVSARKRSESLQNVPVALTAVSKADLENHNATDLTKIAELAPQVIIGQTATGTGALLSIRGISSSSSDSSLDQSVLVDVDGIPMSRGRIISLSTFDMQQVEVMEGPQALFFGKNSPAGVIALQSADPTSVLEGYAKTGYEFEANETYGEAAVSGPIVDGLKARLAVRADYTEGWTRNEAQPIADPFTPGVTEPGANNGSTLPRSHNYAARLTLLWAPTESFDARLKFTLDQQRTNGPTSNSEPFCTPGTTPTELGVPVPQEDCTRNRVLNISGLAPIYAANYPYANGGVPYQDSKFSLTSVTLNQRFSAVTLTSTTGYYDQTVSDGGNYDWSPYAQVWDAEHEHYSLVTQELRANTTLSIPLNFSGGVYYEHSNRPWFNAPQLFNVGLNTTANNYTNSETTAKTTTESYSGFLQARWNIIPTVELAGGARYSHDSKDIVLENIANNPGSSAIGINLYPQGQALPASYRDHNISPEATLSWHPETDQTLYVAYKTGYKAGGLSNSAILNAAATADNIRFAHEKTHGFEIGYKSDLLDHTLRLNVTGYRYNYDGLQVVSYDAQTISFLIGNAAAARTEGVEGSFKWLTVAGLSFNGNAGYNHARYQDFPGAQCYAGQTAAQGCVNGVQDLAGQALLLAPNLTFDLGAEYKMPLVRGWSLDLSMDGSHSASYQTAPDYNPAGVQDAFWRLNASAHIQSPDGHLELSVLGRNLTNEYYLITTVGQAGGGPTQFVGYFNRPREIALEAAYRF